MGISKIGVNNTAIGVFFLFLYCHQLYLMVSCSQILESWKVSVATRVRVSNKIWVIETISYFYILIPLNHCFHANFQPFTYFPVNNRYFLT